MSLTFPTDRRLWFCLLNGPVVYSVYFLIGYLFVEATCEGDLFAFNVLGLDMITFTIIVFTVLAAAVTGYGLFLSLRIWRRTHSTNDATDAAGYVPFMAFTGAWMSGLFTLVTLLTGVPALFVVLCDWI